MVKWKTTSSLIVIFHIFHFKTGWLKCLRGDRDGGKVRRLISNHFGQATTKIPNCLFNVARSAICRLLSLTRFYQEIQHFEVMLVAASKLIASSWHGRLDAYMAALMVLNTMEIACYRINIWIHAWSALQDPRKIYEVN